MERTIVRKRKERTHTVEAEEENCMRRKKKIAAKLGRKRKERPHTLEEEEHCRQKKKEKSKIDVSFSKRRRGLFGKAARLCSDFSDTRLAVLVVSKASRPYAFGHSSVDEVLNDLYHIHPTSTKSVEGLNLMKQLQEHKKVMGVKEEIENEMMGCRTVEGLALLRDKYLKLGEHIKERLRHCSSEEASFEGGEIDQKYNISIISNVGDEGRSLGSRHESSFHNLLNSGGLRLGGITGGEGCCFGLEHKDATAGISGNSLLASTERSYGVHDGNNLTIDGAVDCNGCSLGLWNVDGENSLRVSTTGIGDISWLASTNYSVNDGGLELDLGTGNEVRGHSLLGLTNSTSGNSLCSTTNNYGGGLRLSGDNNGNGCSLGLWHEVSDHPLKDSTTEISSHVLLASATSNHGVDGNLRLNGDIDAEGCSLGLWYEGRDNPFIKDSTADDTVGNVASTTINDGLDGDLRLNGDIIAEGCSSGLWYDVSDNPLREVSAVDSGTVLLASTTRNGGSGGELRSNGDIDALGCSSGLGLEVNGNFSGDLTTGFSDLYFGDFDVSSPLAWDCSSTNGACLERVDPALTDLLQSNTSKGYYSYLMEGDIDSDPYSFEDSCNFLL